MKKHLRVKYVDVNLEFDPNTESSMQCGGKDVILEALNPKYEIEFSDNPDIIFSWYPTCGLKGVDYYKYHCKRCLWLLETEFPDFNVFDYVVSPYHNLKYYDRHLYIPYSIMSFNNAQTEYNYNLTLEKHLNINQDLVQRKFCSFTVSNDVTADTERIVFFKQLNEYKSVDSGGRIYNNIGGKIKNKLEFDSAHKFSIVFENIKGSFITEKLDAAFAGKTIPIYWGNPYVGEIYNSRAFINCHDYASFDDVIKKIIELDNNDDEYLKMLREPAFIVNKSVELYKKELADFLDKIVEGGTCIRSSVGVTKLAEDTRFLGRKYCWKKERRKERLLNLLVFLFKPWTHSRLGQYVKNIIVKK